MFWISKSTITEYGNSVSTNYIGETFLSSNHIHKCLEFNFHWSPGLVCDQSRQKEEHFGLILSHINNHLQSHQFTSVDWFQKCWLDIILLADWQSNAFLEPQDSTTGYSSCSSLAIGRFTEWQEMVFIKLIVIKKISHLGLKFMHLYTDQPYHLNY